MPSASDEAMTDTADCIEIHEVKSESETASDSEQPAFSNISAGVNDSVNTDATSVVVNLSQAPQHSTNASQTCRSWKWSEILMAMFAIMAVLMAVIDFTVEQSKAPERSLAPEEEGFEFCVKALSKSYGIAYMMRRTCLQRPNVKEIRPPSVENTDALLSTWFVAVSAHR
ncbi:hypothetical protein E8E11_011865 [Didymella keratinophila]|nr:hypothetical protein E8E11_011865 [Didymella keratinophila]